MLGYRVYHSLDGSEFAFLDEVGPEQLSYLHDGLDNGEHCYQVTAYRMSEGQTLESEPSNTACKIIDRLSPLSPSNLTVQ